MQKHVSAGEFLSPRFVLQNCGDIVITFGVCMYVCVSVTAISSETVHPTNLKLWCTIGTQIVSCTNIFSSGSNASYGHQGAKCQK